MRFVRRKGKLQNKKNKKNSKIRIIRRVKDMNKSFRLENLDCAVCAAKMERAIAKLDGVNSVSVSFMSGKLFLDANDEKFESVLNDAVKVCKKIEPDCKIIR